VKALLVDDERLARAELRRLLRDVAEIEVVGEAAHVDEAVSRIEELVPDLVFLDIQMPGGSGFDVLERVERVPLVVFTTAFDNHAVRAFEVSALDYLLKPVDPRRLAAAVEKARARLAPPEPTAPPGGGFLERAFVRDGELCLVVDFRDVALFESEGNYTRLYLGEQRPLLGRSLNYLEQRLDPRAFFRANRKELVNLSRISRIEGTPGLGLVLHLPNGREVEMSRRQAQRFRQVLAP
jgi:two-component system LytT family response regulator